MVLFLPPVLPAQTVSFTTVSPIQAPPVPGVISRQDEALLKPNDPFDQLALGERKRRTKQMRKNQRPAWRR